MFLRKHQNGLCPQGLKIKIALIGFIFTLSLSLGCGTLDTLFNEDPQTRLEIYSNRDPRHIRSCGPEALQKALKNLDKDESLSEISIEIQKDKSPEDCFRKFLSVFSSAAREITFPNEMKRFLEKKGFKLKKVKEDSLNKTRDVAIALVKREFN